MLEGMHAQKLKKKIADGSVRLATVGLGYVGLPLSVEFASAGLTVTGIDTNSQKVASIQSGNSYVRDVPAKKISELVDSGHFSATEDSVFSRTMMRSSYACLHRCRKPRIRTCLWW